MQKILVTGASGFWGYNFVKYIESEKKYQITCIYNTDIKPLENLNVKKIQCNLENESEIQKIKDDYDTIIHLASVIKHTKKDSFKNIGINVNSSKNIFKLASEIGKNKPIKVICASTIGTVACFDSDSQFADERSGFSIKSFGFPYYYSKILIEQQADLYRNENIKIIFIRPPVIYGENDLKGRATSRIKKFLNSSLVLYTKGNIPFSDVNDVVKITYDIMCRENCENIYNIDGHHISVKRFYETLEDISGQKKMKIYIPYYLGKIMIPILNKFIKVPDIIEFYMGNCYWNSKSLHLKKYQWISYKETLRKTINYIRSEEREKKKVSILDTIFNNKTKKIVYYIIGIGCLLPFCYYNNNIKTSLLTEGSIFKMNWELI
tara:strand:+ start:813 stop:1946 length:1134 start_codon:yes stop_codon:yes gene_type:complete